MVRALSRTSSPFSDDLLQESKIVSKTDNVRFKPISHHSGRL